MTPLDRLAAIVAKMSPLPWPKEFARSDYPAEGCMACGPVITRDDQDSEEAQAQSDQDGIVALRNAAEELLNVVRCAKRFVPPEGTLLWEWRECDLRDALAALDAKLEKMK